MLGIQVLQGLNQQQLLFQYKIGDAISGVSSRGKALSATQQQDAKEQLLKQAIDKLSTKNLSENAITFYKECIKLLESSVVFSEKPVTKEHTDENGDFFKFDKEANNMAQRLMTHVEEVLDYSISVYQTENTGSKKAATLAITDKPSDDDSKSAKRSNTSAIVVVDDKSSQSKKLQSLRDSYYKSKAQFSSKPENKAFETCKSLKSFYKSVEAPTQLILAKHAESEPTVSKPSDDKSKTSDTTSTPRSTTSTSDSAKPTKAETTTATRRRRKPRHGTFTLVSRKSDKSGKAPSTAKSTKPVAASGNGKGSGSHTKRTGKGDTSATALAVTAPAKSSAKTDVAPKKVPASWKLTIGNLQKVFGSNVSAALSTPEEERAHYLSQVEAIYLQNYNFAEAKVYGDGDCGFHAVKGRTKANHKRPNRKQKDFHTEDSRHGLLGKLGLKFANPTPNRGFDGTKLSQDAKGSIAREIFRHTWLQDYDSPVRSPKRHIFIEGFIETPKDKGSLTKNQLILAYDRFDKASKEQREIRKKVRDEIKQVISNKTKVPVDSIDFPFGAGAIDEKLEENHAIFSELSDKEKEDFKRKIQEANDNLAIAEMELRDVLKSDRCIETYLRHEYAGRREGGTFQHLEFNTGTDQKGVINALADVENVQIFLWQVENGQYKLRNVAWPAGNQSSKAQQRHLLHDGRIHYDMLQLSKANQV